MNKEITIYELLGLIKEGHAPEVIKYKQLTYCKEFDGYYTSNKLKFKLSIMNDLNDKVEIIEEDLLKDIEVIVECEDINIIKMQLINCLYKLNELKEENNEK